ncbi:class I SAM-dependent methyltransferase [Cellulosimicrobium cellulans]|uniref:class I SAM-dependent methyltransferase n=1 Tax=Cellulosimicrobium cellulans TaxID=1710 RepID=UPI0020971A30|nr:class I SAM-dependent methyltransferase [Cellulosimicrobium cellulans]MCO7274313.1 class I SAM-dependent methyltransferase [Cellulosimicrobium cellulans]
MTRPDDQPAADPVPSGPGDATARAASTEDAEYTRRLRELQGARWKRILHVQAPYRWIVRHHLGARRTLDLGCGIGRNLRHLSPGSLGVDHNPASVAFCRSLGMDALTPEGFLDASADGRLPPFDALLVSHVLEHVEQGSQVEMLRPYVERLAAGARVLVVCPQERGFASDPTHTDFVDDRRIAQALDALGVVVDGSRSFPFPRWTGRYFVYNEFVVHGHVPA